MANELELFQKLVRETTVYLGDTGSYTALSYVTLGLAGEAGEIANQVKKIARDDHAQLTWERRLKVVDELGDVFWYAIALCNELQIEPEDVLYMTGQKLRKRQAEGTIKGDKRD